MVETQAFNDIVETTEHGRIFRHGIGHADRGFLEVAGEVRAEIGGAALRTVHIGHGAFEAGGGEHRAQRLASLGRVDDGMLTGKVLFAVFPRFAVFELSIHGFIGMTALEIGFFVCQQFLVFRLLEQGDVVFDLICALGHGVHS